MTSSNAHSPKTIALFGATGTLGKAVAAALSPKYEVLPIQNRLQDKYDIHLMKFRTLLLSLATLAISSCASSNPSFGFNPVDYALRHAAPNSQEISLAQKRLQNFLRRANARQQALLGQNPVVAVQAYEIDANEVPGLIYQLSSGQVGTAVTYYASDPGDPTAVPVKFLLLFDSRTARLVSPEGVLVIDTPSRGTIGNFGGIHAVYAGTGWW